MATGAQNPLINTLRFGITPQGAITTITGTLATTEAPDVVAIAGSVASTTGTDYVHFRRAYISLTRSTARWGFKPQGSVGGAVSGTLATTEAPDVVAIAGNTAVSATDYPHFPRAYVSLTRSTARWGFKPVGTAGGAVTGTLATTEAPDTVAIAGTVSGTTGTLATTEAPDIVAISGSVAASGALTTTEAPDTVAISGSSATGGGNGGSADDRPQRKWRTGLEPIAKVPPKKPAAENPIVLPPDWMRRSPSIAPNVLPIDETHPEIAQAMPGIAQAIAQAERASQQKKHDEQDIADVLSALALLD